MYKMDEKIPSTCIIMYQLSQNQDSSLINKHLVQTAEIYTSRNSHEGAGITEILHVPWLICMMETIVD